MKKIIYYVGCCAWMVTIASCSDDVKNAIDTPLPISPVATQTPDGTLKYMEFTASTGANTRTQLTADNDVVWAANDSISIFDGTANRKFTTKDNGASAVFGGEAKSVETYYALYPYQAGATIENNVIKNVSIPVVQEAKAGSFDGGVNLSVASASTDLQLAFKNVGSLVKFSMSSDKAADVRSVKLTSNDGTAILAGSVNITVGATPTVTATNSQSQVTLKSDTGFEKDKNYYFMVLPGTLSEGFSLTFTDKDNLTWQKIYTTEATMNRSNILRLNDIELGTFTTGLLTNLNLIAAAEASSGQSFTKNADGTVSLLNNDNKAIVEAVTILDLSGKGDSSICNEIVFFNNLEYINCSGNGIINLDFSENLKLTTIICSGEVVEGIRSYNKNRYPRENVNGTLESINIGNNLLLKTLRISNNLLSNLDISNNKELVSLSCHNNNLRILNVNGNDKLTNLSCHGNLLTDLNITNNKELIYLTCSGGNDIESLDLTKNTKLEYAYCGGNNFTSLNVSNNTELITLLVDYSQLSNIDLSKNTKLVNFYCNDSYFTSLNLSNNEELVTLICRNNKLTELDLSKNPLISVFQCFDNYLSSLDISQNTKLDLSKIYVGGQKDGSGNKQYLNLFVNSTQYIQNLAGSYVGDGGLGDDYYHTNDFVNVLLKSDATHEGYNESNYGG